MVSYDVVKSIAFSSDFNIRTWLHKTTNGGLWLVDAPTVGGKIWTWIAPISEIDRLVKQRAGMLSCKSSLVDFPEQAGTGWFE